MPLTKEGAMPKETFWDSATAVEGDDSEPILTVTWGNEQPAVHLNGIEFDRSGINRLIHHLVRARNSTWGADEGDRTVRTVTIKVDADMTGFTESLETARKQIKQISHIS